MFDKGSGRFTVGDAARSRNDAEKTELRPSLTSRDAQKVIQNGL